MSKSVEIVIMPEDDFQVERPPDCQENGVEVPLDRINPDALRNLIAEFVTREWEELGDSRFKLEDKINQVHRQLQEKKAKVVFDLVTNTCNIIPNEGNRNV